MANKKTKREQRKELIIRVICIVMCAILVGTLITAASCAK